MLKTKLIFLAKSRKMYCFKIVHRPDKCIYSPDELNLNVPVLRNNLMKKYYRRIFLGTM